MPPPQAQAGELGGDRRCRCDTSNCFSDFFDRPLTPYLATAVEEATSSDPSYEVGNMPRQFGRRTPRRHSSVYVRTLFNRSRLRETLLVRSASAVPDGGKRKGRSGPDQRAH
jgi:hypothetical protein